MAAITSVWLSWNTVTVPGNLCNFAPSLFWASPAAAFLPAAAIHVTTVTPRSPLRTWRPSVCQALWEKTVCRGKTVAAGIPYVNLGPRALFEPADPCARATV